MRTRVIALLAGLLLLVTAAPADAAVSEVERLAGTNRYETSAAVNCCNPDGTPRRYNSVVLATGLHFADALLGSFLAGVEGGILLLTDGTSLAPGVVELLENTAAGTVTNAYVIGGTGSVSDAAVEQMGEALAQSDNPVSISRVAGDTSIDTAVAIARLRTDDIGGLEDGTRYAIVATVGGFADSLSAAPVAYAANIPILFSRPGDLPPQTKSALEDLAITDVLIVGGTAAIDNVVQSEISSLGIRAQRIAGPTRQETSVEVAEFANGNVDGFLGKGFALARGDQFADALAGGTHAGANDIPILLTLSSTELGFEAAGFLQRQSGTLETGFAYGGTGALSQSVLDAALEASNGTVPE